MRRGAVGLVVSGATAFALTASLLCGCPLLDQSSDAAAPDAGTQTIGAQCQIVYTALCNRAINGCNISTDLETCVNSNMANCPCSGSVCSTTSLQAPQQVTLCTEQIMEEDCSLVVENQVPSYCLPFTTED